MKKIVIVLIVISLGVFLLNIPGTQAIETEPITLVETMEYYFSLFDELTQAEYNEILKDNPDFEDCMLFVAQYAAFLFIIYEMEKIIAER